MKSRTLLLILVVIAFQLLVANNAWACDPTITASAFCDPNTGKAMIQYTSTSWALVDIGGLNPDVRILFNGVQVASGAYAVPDYSFSGTLPAPLSAGPGDTVTVTTVAMGNWGDGEPGGQSASTTVTIPNDPACTQPGLGRFTGGGSQIRVDDVRVTRGLTIHCDLLLSNNLEVNWKGNQFHMTEHMETVSCTDDPQIIQFPPAAPLDTLVGVGKGRYNGVDGYTIRFTFVDAGEPGTSDKASFLVFETAHPSNIVLDVPLQFLTGGNLQAHYDQPHK